MLTFLSTYWLWILLLGGMLFMHLGHRGHGGHGGGGFGGCGGGHAGHGNGDQAESGKNTVHDHSSAPVDLSKSHDPGHQHTQPSA